jgi:DNA repair protein RadC
MDIKTQQLYELRLLKRKTEIELFDPEIKNSRDVARIMRAIHEREGDAVREHVYALFTTQNNRVQGYAVIGVGGMTAAIADPRIVLMHAITSAAAAICLCHNHPSGNLKPSRADEELTKKMKAASELCDIRFLDHLIIADDDQEYFSFADEGLI